MTFIAGLLHKNGSTFYFNSSTMRLSSDLREFVALLNSRGVDYLIVGAYSLAYHARPRFTGDLDLLIRPTPENAAKITTVLNEFGFANLGVTESDFLIPDQIVQLGRVPNRIDLLTSITGVDTEQAFSTGLTTELDGIPGSVLSKALLIANKRAKGRPQDLADLDELRN